MTPVAVGPVVGGSDPAAAAGPEPAVDEVGLEVGSVAPVEVALPPGRPDVPDSPAGDPLLHKVVLGGGLDRHGVHAVPPADVSRVQPVNFQVSTQPTESLRSRSCNCDLWNWESNGYLVGPCSHEKK